MSSRRFKQVSNDDERQIKRWKGIVSRFKGKLIKMIKDVGGKFDDYSISPKIRQILLHWSYESIVAQSFFYFVVFQLKCHYFFVNIKMSYCWFNKQSLSFRTRLFFKNKLVTTLQTVLCL